MPALWVGFLGNASSTGWDDDLDVRQIVFYHFLEVSLHFVGQSVEWLSL